MTLVKWHKEAKSERDLTECTIFIPRSCYVISDLSIPLDLLTMYTLQTKSSMGTPQPQAMMSHNPEMFQDGWRWWTPTHVRCRVLLPTRNRSTIIIRYLISFVTSSTHSNSHCFIPFISVHWSWWLPWSGSRKQLPCIELINSNWTTYRKMRCAMTIHPCCTNWYSTHCSP